MEPKIFLDQKFFGPKTFFYPKIFLDSNTFLDHKIIFLPKIFIWTNIFSEQIFFDQNFFWLKKFSDPNFFDPKWSSLVFGVNQPNQNLLNQRISKSCFMLKQQPSLTNFFLKWSLTLKTKSCSISCFENQFWTHRIKLQIFCKKSFLIRGLEVGEIIPFPVWIIPFPVLKINFETLGTYEKHFVKEVFWSEAWKREK